MTTRKRKGSVSLAAMAFTMKKAESDWDIFLAGRGVGRVVKDGDVYTGRVTYGRVGFKATGSTPRAALEALVYRVNQFRGCYPPPRTLSGAPEPFVRRSAGTVSGGLPSLGKRC